MSKMTLKEHRERLAKNKDKTDIDLPRCYKTFKNHLKNCGYHRTPVDIIKKIVDLIWKAQDEKPFFYTEDKDGIPMVWSRPADWSKHDHFRYEWGHLVSINQKGHAANYIENFALMTARGNQQLQTSLNIDEVFELFDGSKTGVTIFKNLSRRKRLFASNVWKDLMRSIEKYHVKQGVETKVEKVKDVIQSWSAGENSTSQNVQSVDGLLYSYALPIACKYENFLFICNYTKRRINGCDGKWYSKYTSQHVGQAMRGLDALGKEYHVVHHVEFEKFLDKLSQ